MKTIYLILVFSVCYLSACAQKLERNEQDKYTKSDIKETSWFKLKTKFTQVLACRAKKINETRYLELSISMHEVFRYDEGDIAYLLLENGTTVEIKCIRGGVADYNYDKYATYWNGKYLFALTDSDFDNLKTNKLIGVRVNLGESYLTFEGIRGVNVERLQKALTLID